jgi:hypothetical protein
MIQGIGFACNPLRQVSRTTPKDWTAKMIDLKLQPKLKDSGLQRLKPFILIAVALWLAFFQLRCGGGSGGDSATAPADDTPNGNGSAEIIACGDPEDSDAGGQLFYIDPLNGNPDNDGSAAHPWRTLQEVIEAGRIETRVYANLPYDGTNAFATINPGAPVQAGDTLVLRSGFHGSLWIRGGYNERTITIRADAGQTPVVSGIFLSAVSNWRVQGLTVAPDPAVEAGTLVQVESHGWHGPSSHVVIAANNLYSTQDSTAWTMDDWNTLAHNGIMVSGDCMTVVDNYCKNVDFGITVSGNSAVVSGNTVENFAGDGLRGLGNDLLFEYNVVRNCYAVNANHDDGFQSWSINDDPPRERVVLRGNIIINYTDPDQPFRGPLQGIGCFDGPYIDWVVENNLVVVDHWHGISLYGAFNSRIVNNTVVDPDWGSPGPAWIYISPHKDGTPSQGCLIRNNIAATITATGDTLQDHNYLLKSTDNLFIDPQQLDFHPRNGATQIINAGSATLAPLVDLEGRARPLGGGVDLGCYELE